MCVRGGGGFFVAPLLGRRVRDVSRRFFFSLVSLVWWFFLIGVNEGGLTVS